MTERPARTAVGANRDQQALGAASELLRVLGTPHRLAIVLELAKGPRCVHELVELLGISQSLTSQHLRVLRTAGLAVGRRRGKETAYSLADEHVAHIAGDALAHGVELGRPLKPRPESDDQVPTEPTEQEEHSTP